MVLLRGSGGAGYGRVAAQQDSFRWHIDLAKRLGKPLMIHDRDAHEDVLDILEDEGPPPYTSHAHGGATAALAVASALYQRTHTGRGQLVDVAMLDAVTALLELEGVDRVEPEAFAEQRCRIADLFGRHRKPETADNGLLDLGFQVIQRCSHKV